MSDGLLLENSFFTGGRNIEENLRLEETSRPQPLTPDPNPSLQTPTPHSRPQPLTPDPNPSLQTPTPHSRPQPLTPPPLHSPIPH
ncbi:Hypp8565 [Branchiostoma lanceolatum]|uniref:Hypp8565 protein n=1 Tax=Branchiostoma lanceolatum TaxID=7740 RepID=A0A8J9Z8U2_BRALA|nr:Hypp8565 [Branchiostoma lanceolatum]